MPLILDARGRHLFPLVFKHLPLFLNIYIHFFSENSLVGCPRLDARSRRTLPHTPLHATVERVKVLFFSILLFKNMRLSRAENVLHFARNIQNRVRFWGSAPDPAGQLTTLPQTP